MLIQELALLLDIVSEQLFSKARMTKVIEESDICRHMHLFNLLHLNIMTSGFLNES